MAQCWRTSYWLEPSMLKFLPIIPELPKKHPHNSFSILVSNLTFLKLSVLLEYLSVLLE